MAIQPVSLDRLKSQLLTSGLQQKNQPLFQVINQLIDYLRQSIAATQATFDSGGGGGGGGGTTTVNYETNNYWSPYEPLDGDDSLVPGAMGPPGFTGANGAQGNAGMPGIPGEDGQDGDASIIIYGNVGSSSAQSAAFVQFTKDLGAVYRSGTFDITGLSSLTVGKPVLVFQTMDPISTKGDARDEFEMDAIVLTGYVFDANTIRVLWFTANGSVAVGTYAFAYLVGA